MSVSARDATEADLSGILTIYNQVVRTTAAAYTEQEGTLEDRPVRFAQRADPGYPVLVADDPGAGAVQGFSAFGDLRPWPGYRRTDAANPASLRLHDRLGFGWVGTCTRSAPSLAVHSTWYSCSAFLMRRMKA